jgi:cysteine synthase A
MMTIGNTPLVRLEVLPGEGSADVFVKWEGANPTGSMKDRMALSMIAGAEGRGWRGRRGSSGGSRRGRTSGRPCRGRGSSGRGAAW